MVDELGSMVDELGSMVDELGAKVDELSVFWSRRDVSGAEVDDVLGSWVDVLCFELEGLGAMVEDELPPPHSSKIVA